MKSPDKVHQCNIALVGFFHNICCLFWHLERVWFFEETCGRKKNTECSQSVFFLHFNTTNPNTSAFPILLIPEKTPGSPTNIPNRQRPHEHPDQALEHTGQTSTETQASHSLVWWFCRFQMIEWQIYKICQVVAIPQNSVGKINATIWTAPPNSQPSLVDDVVSCFNTSTETELSCQHELCNSVPKLSVHPSRNSPCLHVFWNLLDLCIHHQRYISIYFIHNYCSRYHIYIYTYKTFQGG